jgi:hypothetical protein
MAAIFLVLKTGIYKVRIGVVSLQSRNHQCRREGGEAGTNYRGLVVRKEAQGWITRMLPMFLSFSMVSLFVDCTN